MRTRTWLCGVFLGGGMALTIPPVAPPTSEEMVEPEVREAVDESRTLLGNTLGEEHPTRIIELEELNKVMKARFPSKPLQLDAEQVRALAENKLQEARTEIGNTMDAFHKAASKADFDAYFALMHDDGMFLGTDASERWTKAQFMDYARPFMVGQGKGWTYHPRDRHVSVRGDVAWFDELIDNDTYGTLRGQGVLVREGGAWKVMQYSYSFAVPNDKAPGVVELIMSGDEGRDEADAEP